MNKKGYVEISCRNRKTNQLLSGYARLRIPIRHSNNNIAKISYVEENKTWSGENIPHNLYDCGVLSVGNIVDNVEYTDAWERLI